MNRPNTNDFVRVEDLVHFLCQNLSPAASYSICTGCRKQGEYGEVTVQRILVQPKNNARLAQEISGKQLVDYADKERGLVDFFKSEPGVYDLELVGVTPDKLPKENYQVRLAVVDLLDSDDEV